MLHSKLLDRAVLSTALGLFSLMSVPHTAHGQGASAGGFGNFGLGSSSGFGNFGGTGTNTGQTATGGMGSTGGLGAMGGTGGQAGGLGGLGGQAGGLGGLGGSGGIGSSFDPNFGASQIASSLATAAAVSRVTSSAMGGRGGFGAGGGGFGGGRGGQGGRNGNQNAQSETKVRAVLRIGFPVENRTGIATTQRVSERFGKMPLPPGLGNVQIIMEGRTAILRGEVDAAEDVKLVERILSLEPGIDGVKNELVVASAISDPATGAEVVPLPRP